jgi:hypothetical protein
MSTYDTDTEGIHALFADLEGPVAKILLQKAFQIETLAKTFLTIPGSGRLYEPGSYFMKHNGKLYHWVQTGPAHRASAPGQPPASNTGFLLNQIGHRVELGGEVVIARVTANTKYAHYLEVGTSLMKPRPFLKPAMDAVVNS